MSQLVFLCYVRFIFIAKDIRGVQQEQSIASRGRVVNLISVVFCQPDRITSRREREEGEGERGVREKGTEGKGEGDGE